MSAGGRSRAAAVALLLGLTAVAGAAILLPAALYWSKTGSEIRDARSKMLRATQQNEASAELIATRSAWSAFAAAETSGFVLEQTDEVAEASSAARVKAVFATFGGEADAISAEAIEGPREGVRRISLDIRGSVPRSSLGDFLGALESKAPFVIVEDFKAEVKSGDEVSIRLTGSSYRLLEGGS